MAIVWMMIVWAVMIGIASFAVDYGRVQLAKTELLVAADAASRAAIGALPGGVTAAQDAAIELAGKNRCDGIAVVLKRNEDVEFLNYDRYSGVSTALNGSARAGANAVRVTVRRTSARGNPVKLLFGAVIGKSECDVVSRSTAAIGGNPGYLGVSLTRMFDNSRFDAYNSFAGPYSSGSATSGNLLSNEDMELHDSARVVGEAHWGPGGTLKKDSGITVSPGPLTQINTVGTWTPVALGSVASVNDNSQITLYRAGTKFKMPKSGATATFPGGTYYFTDFEVTPGSVVTFSGPTTIFIDGNAAIEGVVTAPSQRPYMLKIKLTAKSKCEINNGGKVYAHIYGPEADVHHHGGESFGSVVSDLLCFRETGKGHQDTEGSTSVGSGSSRIQVVK